MSMFMKSPAITHLSWGRIEVSGSQGPFKDAKLFPGGAREWDWRETGTRHHPGVQPADVEELLDNGAERVVLGVGVFKRLGVCPETLGFLENRAAPVEVLETSRAVERYNQLADTELVGALIHSTC
jgi:hypothetical protein